MQFEDILAQIGDEGPFQIWLMALLLLPTSLFNPFYDSIILMATPDHWCRVSDLEKLPQSVQQQLIRPANSSGKDATCFRYDINYQSIRSMTDLQSYLVSSTNYSTLGEVPVVRCSDGYLYDQSLYSETPISWVGVDSIAKFLLIFFAFLLKFQSTILFVIMTTTPTTFSHCR